MPLTLTGAAIAIAESRVAVIIVVNRMLWRVFEKKWKWCIVHERKREIELDIKRPDGRRGTWRARRARTLRAIRGIVARARECRANEICFPFRAQFQEY